MNKIISTFCFVISIICYNHSFAQSSAIFKYGASYVGAYDGNLGMNNVQPSTTFGIVNVMLTNVSLAPSGNDLNATAIIETSSGQTYTLAGGFVYSKANGNPTQYYHWRPNASSSQQINVGSTQLLLTGSTTATTGYNTTTGIATFTGITVVKYGQNPSISSGSNLNGNNSGLLTEFNNYAASIPQITTNAPISFTNVQVNSWGGTSSAASVTGSGIFYNTTATVVAGSTGNSTGTNVAITYSSANTSFSTNTSGLMPNTQYYYRAYVIVGGTYYQGLLQTFTTCANTPTPSTNASQTFCLSSNPTISSLSASPNVSGGTLHWYSDGSGLNLLSGGTALTTGTYYVGQTACTSVKSSLVAVSVVVDALPVAGVIDYGVNDYVCINESKVLSLSGSTGSIQWQKSTDYLNYTNIAGATNTTYTTPSLSETTYFKAILTSGQCGSATTSVQAITVNSPSATPEILGTNLVCPNTSTTLNLSNWTGDIEWFSSNTINGTYSSLSTTIEVLNTGALSVPTYFKAQATSPGCTATESAIFLVDIITNNPGSISVISGPSTVTPGGTAIYSVDEVSNASSYVWSLPAGLTITSNDLNGSLINVNVSNNYPGGVISVYALGCVTTNSQSKTVNISGQNGISISTTQPGAPVICGGTNGVSFSVTEATGATYSWTLPAGLSLASGFYGNEQTIQINFASNYEGGAISCTRTTSSSTNTAYYAVGGLATPGNITGPTALCDLTNATYTIASVSNANNYEWSLPTGMSISSGSGTIMIGTNLSGNVSGTLKVRAVSSTCGTSGWRSLTVGSIAQPSGISGPTLICGAAVYTITGTTMTQVSQTTLNYSVTNVSGMDYTWTVPSGMTITSGNGTNTIVVEVDPTAFTNGQVSVSATSQTNNSCVSSMRTLNVSKAVSAISGPTALCGLTTATYSVPSDAGSSFTWTLPSWMTPASGYSLTSNPINVDIASSGTSLQTISVDIITSCGNVTSSKTIGCDLYTQLSAASCNATLPSLGWGISANNVSAASAYIFEVTDANDNIYLITSTDRWITLSEASGMNVTYSQPYEIRVKVFAYNAWQDYGSSCTVNTPAIPFGTLSSTSCNSTLPSIGWGISATNVAGATKYRFNVSVPTLGATIYTIESVDRWITLSEVSSLPLLYATSYNFTVEVECGTGIWGSAGSSCSINTPAIPAGSLSSTSCNSSLPSMGWGISATNVAAATAYRFNITAPGNATPYVVTSPDRWITLSEATNMPLLYGTSYTITVQVESGTGNWGNVGSSCTVSTPAIPTTTLSTASCGATLPSLSWGISATNVAAATAYRFNITAPGNATPYVVTSSDRWITLSEATGMPLLYASTYSITVEVENGTGNWGAPGTACNVITPDIPTIGLSTASCGATLPSLGWGISATNVAAATQYEFQIIGQTGAQLNVEYYVLSPDRWITLSEGMTINNVPLVPQNNQEFVIRVRAYSGTAHGEYAESGCIVYTPITSQGLIVQDQDPQLYTEQAEGLGSEVTEAQSALIENQNQLQVTWSATATSNPFEHSFKVNLNGAEAIDAAESFTAQLTDMSGKVYTLQTLNKEQLETASFGEQLSPGMYMLTLSQGTQVQVLRVVKR